jgi:hypothetical protein
LSFDSRHTLADELGPARDLNHIPGNLFDPRSRWTLRLHPLGVVDRFGHHVLCGQAARQFAQVA